MQSLLQNSIIRYLFIAVILVTFELVLFNIFLFWLDSYIWATAFSFGIAVIGNWFLSRSIVFRFSRYKIVTELILVSIASVVGLGIQLAIVYLAVEKLYIAPLSGKAISIIGSFFWNYWARAKYIFNAKEL